MPPIDLSVILASGNKYGSPERIAGGSSVCSTCIASYSEQGNVKYTCSESSR